MYTETKRRTLADFEAAIELPEKSFFIKGETNIRFAYKMYGKFKYINLASRLEVAQFLKRAGIIKSYAVIGERVEMFVKGFATSMTDNGVPVMSETSTKLKWEDLMFSNYEVIRFAAENEWEKTVGKVIRGTFNITRSIKNAI